MTHPHGALAGAARVAAIAAALVIAGLLYTIKADLASIGAAILQRDAGPQSVNVAHQEAEMSNLKKCLCSPTLGLITVITTCARNETPEECAERHRQAIARWKAAVPDAVDCECPPD